jgi:hypothetical protein
MLIETQWHIRGQKQGNSSYRLLMVSPSIACDLNYYEAEGSAVATNINSCSGSFTQVTHRVIPNDAQQQLNHSCDMRLSNVELEYCVDETVRCRLSRQTPWAFCWRRRASIVRPAAAARRDVNYIGL